MDLGKVATIVQALQACEVLFGDVKPTHYEVTSFRMKNDKIEKFVTKDNATSFQITPVKFDGLAFKDIRLQMSIKEGKTMVGGEVLEARRTLQCPVIGDDKELKLVATCASDTCPYLFGDAVYWIFNDPEIDCRAYKAPKVIDAKAEQPNINCAERFGVDDVLGMFYFKKNGTCMNVDVDTFKDPWSPSVCGPFSTIHLKLGAQTQYFHLRYLTIAADCGMPNSITEGMIDNTFIRFTFIDPTEKTTLPNMTTAAAFVLNEVGIAFLAAGSAAILLFLGLAIFGIVVCVKCRERCICCCKEKVAPKEKLPAVRAAKVQQPYDLYPEYSMDEKTKSVKEEKEEEIKDAEEESGWSAAVDSFGNVDENLKTVNPMDHLVMDELPSDLVHDSEFEGSVPSVIVRNKTYVHKEKLGQGSFGAVYSFEVGRGSGHFVAIKFVKASNEAELRYAKKEFMQVRQIERLLNNKFPNVKESLLAEILDVGRNVSTVYMIMPLYYRNMSFVWRRDTNLKLQQKLNIAYHLLQPILPLQLVKYAHLDVKPENYMQKMERCNTCILCDFGLSRRFGSMRSAEGTPGFLSAPAHKGLRTSIMDDMQSWLITVIIVLLQTAPWMERSLVKMDDIELKASNIETFHERMLKRQFHLKKIFFEKLVRVSHENGIIIDLAEMIWCSECRKKNINIPKVLAYLDKLQQTFKFKYTDPWWDDNKVYEKIVFVLTDAPTQKSLDDTQKTISKRSRRSHRKVKIPGI